MANVSTAELFLAWLRTEILSTGAVQEDEVFDARDKSLRWILESKMAAALGCAVLISLPKWNRMETQAAARDHELSVAVIIRTNPSLNADRNGYAIAETLYTALDGKAFRPAASPGAILIANVSADALTSNGDEERRSMSSFVVKCRIQLD